MIESMKEIHLDEVVNVHLQSFKGFFLTFLGEKFLRLYYKGIVYHNEAIKLVYLEDSEVKGFIVGSINPSGFNLLY